MRSRRSLAPAAVSRVVVTGLVVSGLTVAGGGAAHAAELPDAVRAAAYLGADALSETSLPATVSDGTADHDVTWHFDAETFAVPYETVQVHGEVDGQDITATVEVLPPADNPLVYFVDAGHNGDSQSRSYSNLLTESQAFEAVATLAEPTLVNDLPDQRHVDGETGWGYTYDATNNYKISVSGGDPSPGDYAQLSAFGKYELGVRTNGTSITDRLSLDPGEYTLSSGFFEFYAGSQARTRGIVPTISYTVDGARTSTALDRAVLSTPANAASPKLLVTTAFTIPEGASDIRLSYVKDSGEAPSLSWFAIAQGDAEQRIDEAVTAAASIVELDIDANDIAADNVNGLTFKGFGVLSANSTSSVLMDYKAEHPEAYAQLLQVLFGGENPIMNTVKIEMGNDRNNSTGPDPATMRTEDEPANVTRHPGFQLAADALMVNPDLKISILRWNAPAWANTNDKIYTWYKNTILAAYREYGYMVDYVNPGVNEHAADLAWTKDFANRVKTDTTGYVSGDAALAGFRDGEAELFHRIKTVISDEVGTGTFGDEMVDDASLRDAVSVAGFHYNTNDDSAGNFTKLADEYDVEVWNSEAQATFSNSSFRQNNNTADPTVEGTGIGGTGSALEMANTIIKGFVNSRRTAFVYQPAIGSFFEGGQYSFKELVSARDPWSGWIHYDAGLAVLQHFASFADTGWENGDNTAGIWRGIPSASASGATGTNPVSGRNGLPTYMTMAAPDASDFSTVIVNDSEYPRTYRLTAQNFSLADDELAVWQTRAGDDGEGFDANYKRHVADVAPSAAGTYTVQVAPYSIVTVTSLDVTADESWTSALPVEGERAVLDQGTDADGVLWSDDYDYTDREVPVIADGGGLSGETESFVASRGGESGVIPLYMWSRNGSFEASRTEDGEWVLRQQLDKDTTGVGGAWNGGDPVAAVGERRWTNYTASVDVLLERVAASDNYAALGVRSSGGSGSASISGTPYVLKLWKDGGWQFLRRGSVVDSGTVAGDGWDGSAWHRLSVTAAGSTVSGSIDGDEVFSWTDTAPFLSGWVDLASGFHNVQFDNLAVETVADELPYYSEYLDDLEMNDLAEVPVATLVYDGSWSHDNGRGMYEYQRSRSVNREAGAGVSYAFTGSGLDVLAQHDGSARLDVYVDGDLIAQNAATTASGEFQATYSLRGLPWGAHTVRIVVASGTLGIDAIAVAGIPATDAAETAALAAAVADASDIVRDDDYTDADWQVLQANLHDAQAAVADPVGYRLDATGAAQLEARLRAASFPLASRIRSLPTTYAATYVDEALTGLPGELTATMTDGTTRSVPITWATDDVDLSQAWSTVVVSGSYGSASATARVEVVPRGTIAFGDVNKTASSLGYDSPAYTAIRDLVGDLVNDAPDQRLADGADWGHWAKSPSGVLVTPSYKGILSGPFDKMTTTGMYTANQVGASEGYTFTLPAGRYAIAAGSYSWWPGNARSADVVLTYDGEAHTVDSFTLDTATPGRVLSYDIELAEDGPVTLSLVATNAQSPMLSWAGVTTGAYGVSFDLAGGTGSVPAAASGLWWDDVVAAPATDPARYAYEFAGWNTKADGSGVQLTGTMPVSALADGDRGATELTLHAVWEQAASTWEATAVYTTGDRVFSDGRIFEAQWWSRGQVPGESAYSAWAEVGAPVACTVGTVQKWTASWVYTGGETVVHDGRVWQAEWWTRNQEPGTGKHSPWLEMGGCLD